MCHETIKKSSQLVIGLAHCASFELTAYQCLYLGKTFWNLSPSESQWHSLTVFFLNTGTA